MTSTRCSLAGALILALVAIAPLTAQGAAKQKTLDNHVQNQLWPSRALSPTETEFKERIVAMRDTIIALQASIDQADRARRTRHSPAVLLSQSREVGAACTRVERNVAALKGFAAGLSTNDRRFGDPAIERFRSAIATLHSTSTKCRTDIDGLISAGQKDVDPDKLLKVFDAMRTAAADYGVAAQVLAKTLDIRIEATDKS